MVSKIEDLAQKLLKDKGIIVCPYQRGPMLILKKDLGVIRTQSTQEQYAFVPLIL